MNGSHPPGSKAAGAGASTGQRVLAALKALPAALQRAVIGVLDCIILTAPKLIRSCLMLILVAVCAAVAWISVCALWWAVVHAMEFFFE